MKRLIFIISMLLFTVSGFATMFIVEVTAVSLLGFATALIDNFLKKGPTLAEKQAFANRRGSNY